MLGFYLLMIVVSAVVKMSDASTSSTSPWLMAIPTILSTILLAPATGRPGNTSATRIAAGA